MKKKSFIPGLFIFAAAAFAASSLPAGAATTVFSDGTLNPSHWTSVEIVDTTSGGAATFSASQQSSGGNPGDYRQVSHTYPAGAIIVSHLSNTSAPTPICWYPSSLGEITTIDYCYDLAHFTGTGSNAVAYSVLAFQNGNYYRGNWNNVFSTSWTSYSHTGLTASSFGLITTATPSLVDFSQNPDFGPSGGNIFFGFVSGNSHNTSGAIGVTTSGVDNFRLTVHHAVPEPSSCSASDGMFELT